MSLSKGLSQDYAVVRLQVVVISPTLSLVPDAWPCKGWRVVELQDLRPGLAIHSDRHRKRENVASDAASGSEINLDLRTRHTNRLVERRSVR